MSDSLLIELLTEELPPKSLETLSAMFADNLLALLTTDGLLDTGSSHVAYGTPRRLAVLFTNVFERATDKPATLQGPSVKAGLDKEGKPTPALLGFAKKCGVDPSALERVTTEKGEQFVHRSVQSGTSLDAALSAHVQEALRKLPIPKMMRWGASDIQFVRPVHSLIMLHGERVVPGTVLGLASDRLTLGHRFLSEGEISITNADDYAARLEEGFVLAEFSRRRARIKQLLEERAGSNASFGEGFDVLLSEVTALVEYPCIYEGVFEERFLEVPQECLVLSMKQHQKYFPLLDSRSGKLLNRFLIVSNLETDDPRNIITGNERVLRARLSDAKFFYDQDRKAKLADRVDRLGNVVYHNKLGSQLERVQRVRKLAGAIAAKLGADVGQAERAAWLAKADLLTDMVGEFPELQGIMGQYYALHDGEPEAVARAIEAHYHPRFANDALPADHIGCAVALADKLDTLVGIYGVGLIPTGDKDPFGLRRQALGALRILSEKALPLDLLELLELAKSGFAPGVVQDGVANDLHHFMLERLRGYLRERGFAADEIDAVVSQNPTRIDRVEPRLKAVQTFRAMPEAESLASANKRIRNILKKAAITRTQPDPALLQENAEKNLYAAASALMPTVSSLWEREDYTAALRALAGVRSEVDKFFDDVMVMTDDAAVRDNRLALLVQLETLLNRVADISKLAA